MSSGQDSSPNHHPKNNLYQKIVFLLILGPICLLFIDLFLTIPVTRLSLLDLSVTDGNVNGAITLGTAGYCLYLPNEACSHFSFGYKIGQFFSNYRIL